MIHRESKLFKIGCRTILCEWVQRLKKHSPFVLNVAWCLSYCDLDDSQCELVATASKILARIF